LKEIGFGRGTGNPWNPSSPSHREKSCFFT
jgi:hypothetical protein